MSEGPDAFWSLSHFLAKRTAMKIYGDLKSGNCLKVKWTADLLGLAYTWVPVDIMKGESRTPGYLAKFAQGQVPAVELADGRTLAQSNAIIRYLARGSRLLPEDAFTQAKIDEWLFWEQYSHEPYVATCRFHMTYLGKSKETRDPSKVERAEKALDHMELMLAGRTFLIGDALTIADIALYAYTHVADEGGFDLATRPHVRAWLAQCTHEIGGQA
jgi:glutathione S-transferase